MRKVKVTLNINGQISSMDLLPEMIIGRSSRATIILPEPGISRQHTRLFLRDGQIFVEDMGSRNGTWLDGMEIKSPASLSPGQKVRFDSFNESQTGGIFLFLEERAATENEFGVNSIFRSAIDMMHTGLAQVDSRTGSSYTERLRVLNEIHQALSKPVSIDTLLDMLLERSISLLNADGGAIILDEKGDLTRPTLIRGDLGHRMKLLKSSTLKHEVMEKRQALLSLDMVDDKRFNNAESVLNQESTSVMAAPMFDAEGCLGMIVLSSAGAEALFTEDDLVLLTALASAGTMKLRSMGKMEEAAVKLRDINQILSRNVEERTKALDARNNELEMLDKIVREVNSEVRFKPMLDSLLNAGQRLFPGADAGLILLRDDSDFMVVASHPEETSFRPREPLTEELLYTLWVGEATRVEMGVYLPQNAQDCWPFTGECPQSLLVMSVTDGHETVGYQVLASFNGQERFGFSDVRVLARFRDHVIISLTKARLMENLVRKNEEIARAQDQLIISAKMAGMGRLSGGVAHEINNPNNFIWGATQNLERDVGRFREYLFALAEDPDIRSSFEEWFGKLDKHTKVIGSGSSRITEIVQALQQVTHRDMAEWKRVDIIRNLRATISLLVPQIRDRIQVHNAECDPLELACYPSELNQVFMHLVDNAYKAVIDKYPPEETGNLYITSKVESDQLVICFRDDGCGIAPEHQDRIFEAFYTTREVGSGVGLGLYSSYNIVQKHGGELNMVTEPGQGTSMTICLPLD